MDTRDAIVVGGGIAGLSAACRLAEAGLRVLVVERRRVGAEASGAAAGMIGPQAESDPHSPLLALSLRARDHLLDLVPRLQEETGIDLDLSPRGALHVAFTDGDIHALDAREAWQRARGLEVERLGADEIRDAEPNLSPEVRGGLFLRGDRRLDNARLTRALAARAVSRGAAILAGRPVNGLTVEGGRVTGVRAGREAFAAPLVVNAAGAWAALLGADPLPPPVEPVRGQILAFETVPALLRHVVWSPRGYVVPTSDGRLLAGSTLERAGYDKSVTAGGLRHLTQVALEMAPRLADVRVLDSWAGLRPGTPDDLPVLGAGSLPGLFHVAGLYRNGILLGPWIGDVVARLALGEPPPVDLRPFSLDRFRA